MKKILTVIMLICLTAVLMTACQQGKGAEKEKGPENDTAETASVGGADAYKIGVIVYSSTDEEVIAFREYLEQYIAEVYPGITFIYSDSILTEEEELDFIQKACDEGACGFLSFLSLDLAKEVDLCARNEAYYILASGTVTDEAFRKVEDNPYFIGAVGPGTELEYETGSDMAAFFAKQKFGDEYFIMSGGASLGNEMHRQRTLGILDSLQQAYGVTFDRSSKEIASSQTPVRAAAGELQICLVPGYINSEETLRTAVEEYGKDRFGIVLSVLPAYDMADEARQAHLGVIDCYSERNLQLFNRKQLNYVAGKYSSIIGPSFAAMYNAVTGYADEFREDGKAFRLTQGFWCSDHYDDYVEKYTLANSVVSNAYNYEDLGGVCKVFNPDARLEDLEKLAEAYTYEDALKRRGK